LNCRDPPPGRQLFRSEDLNDRLAAFELIDFGDEFEDFGCDRDVRNAAHGRYAISPISYPTQRQETSIYSHFQPFGIQ
jgi:hypothetical protein